MASSEEVKRPKDKTSRLASPQTLGGKPVYTSISKDPMDLILSMAGKAGHNTNFSGKAISACIFVLPG